MQGKNYICVHQSMMFNSVCCYYCKFGRKLVVALDTQFRAPLRCGSLILGINYCFK